MSDFEFEREMMKTIIEEQSKFFIDMLNDVDDPPGLIYETQIGKILLKISIELC
jgi:hypothetical protein